MVDLLEVRAVLFPARSERMCWPAAGWRLCTWPAVARVTNNKKPRVVNRQAHSILEVFDRRSSRKQAKTGKRRDESNDQGERLAREGKCGTAESRTWQTLITDQDFAGLGTTRPGGTASA